MNGVSAASLASRIEHTLLKPTATDAEIKKLCDEAKEHKFRAVCVNPYRVKEAVSHLKGSGIPVCVVIGFPLGANETRTKVEEVSLARLRGARQFDMVINIGAVKSGNWSLVERDIKAVVATAKGDEVKVIFETCFLTEEEIRKCCQITNRAGAHYDKTSTGFGSGGATEKAIQIMREEAREHKKIKASGGIKTLTDVEKLRKADVFGTSSGVEIMKQLQSKL